MLLEYALVSGLLFGVFYALLASGLNLAFGMQRIVNLAHGDVVMLGGFGAWELYYGFGVPPLVTLLIVVPLAVAAGFLLFQAVTPRLSRSDDPEMLSLVLFFGISQTIEAAAALTLSNNQRSLPSSSLAGHPMTIAGQTYPGTLVVSAIVSLPILAALFLYLYRSPLGRATRAVMADPQEAAAVGIAVKRVSSLSFGVSLALAAMAGVLGIFLFGGASPSEGVGLTVISFAVIVLGSLGNPLGTLVGGVVYGIAYELTQTYLSSWADLVPYVLLLVVMLTRPSGLLGRSARRA
ncbi:MAG: branched-chain amino acid ABC transporter permease [Actinomycetota bacterium]|nr:branched-chain amino acid ABC transporter permease [Actinomycetota bacterium]